MKRLITVQNQDAVGPRFHQTVKSYKVLGEDSFQVGVARYGNACNTRLTICTHTKAVHIKVRGYFSQTEAIPISFCIKQAAYFIIE